MFDEGNLPMAGPKYIVETLKQAGFDCGPLEARLLDMLADKLLEYNRNVNLTAIRDYEGVVTRHFADSLHILKAVDIGGKSVIDVGCGAGFPSLPLKIFVPSADVTCLDSTGKKLAFIDRFIHDAGLEGVRTLDARAEVAAHNAAHREKYDVAVSRAVAGLCELCELCLPLVKPGGMMISMKSGTAEGELSQAADVIIKLGGKVDQIHGYQIKFKHKDMHMCMIIIKKISQTPANYPRKYAQIAKSPTK